MRVALVETDTVWEDPAANRLRIADLGVDADVAVCPELRHEFPALDDARRDRYGWIR